MTKTELLERLAVLPKEADVATVIVEATPASEGVEYMKAADGPEKSFVVIKSNIHRMNDVDWT